MNINEIRWVYAGPSYARSREIVDGLYGHYASCRRMACIKCSVPSYVLEIKTLGHCADNVRRQPLTVDSREQRIQTGRDKR